MALDNLVITIDEGVPAPDVVRFGFGARESKAAKFDADLKKLKIGSSFFIPNVERKDTDFLIRRGKKLGIYLVARSTKNDEVYNLPGVRIGRVSEADAPKPRGPRKPKADAAPAAAPASSKDDEL
jgi:hypothetical protein